MITSEILIPVRNYHADNQNHVNNARYLEFFEEGSWDYQDRNPNVKRLFEQLLERGIAHAAVNMNCNYRSSAVVGDILRLETGLVRATERSYVWSKKIYNNDTGTLVVDAEITCVFIDQSTGKSVVIDQEMKAQWPDLDARV